MAYSSDNALYVSDLKRGSFFADQWMKELGLKQKKEWPGNQVKIGPALLINCPPTYPYAPLRVSKEMCKAKALITNGYAGGACQRLGRVPPILIDRYILKRDGAYQAWITPNSVEVKSIRKSLGQRPWSF